MSLVIMSVCLLSMIGCSDKKSDVIDNSENLDNVEISEVLSLGETERNYILVDSYFVTDDMREDVGGHMIREGEKYEFDNYGTNVSISLNIDENTDDLEKYYVLNLKMNVREFSLKYPELQGIRVNVIDFNEFDNKKELIITEGCLTEPTYVYDIVDNDIVEIFTSDGMNTKGIEKISGKYVILNYVDSPYYFDMDGSLVISYAIYEDGEFKLIDRSLNGEKIVDENGYLTENFKDKMKDYMHFYDTSAT